MQANNAIIYWQALRGVPSSTPPATPPATSESNDEEELSLILYESKFNIDKWYHSCADFTFPTWLTEVSRVQAEAAIAYHEHHFLPPSHLKPKRAFGQPQQQIISDWKDTIDQQMQQLAQQHAPSSVSSSYGFFVRLSARSPKDSGFQNERMKRILDDKLAHAPAALDSGDNNSAEERQNQEFIAFFSAQIESLRVTTAGEALTLLLSSERVYDDLQRALIATDSNSSNSNNGNNTKNNNNNDNSATDNANNSLDIFLAVRLWVPIHISREFRGFVYKRKLTALSQYFDMLYFPDLHMHKQKILQKIQQFFNDVSEKIPYDNCVMDFGLVDNDNTVKLIEFNPWYRFTSPCLFSWKSDMSVLTGAQPFQFRIVERPLEVLREQQPPPQLHLVHQADDPFAAFGDNNEISADILAEHGDLLELVKSHLEDNVERINANLRYILNKRKKGL